MSDPAILRKEAGLLAAKPQQMALDLPVEARLGIEDFLVGTSNEVAYSVIEAWPHWPDPILVLTGPEGSGKSHLAAIWAARAHAWSIGARDLTLENVPGLTGQGALVLEDCDTQGRDDKALFHLMNAMRARGGADRGAILMTARTAVEQWGVTIPDVASRLRLAQHAAIDMPEDALLRAVLVKHFVDRQLIVDTGLVETLTLRMERSFKQAGELVAALDRMSLERGRRLTRAMALEALALLPAAE
jgi:chromosomal replication initiation ATPase DnaA